MRTALASLALVFGLSFSLSATPVKTGFGEVDISPDIGMERPGGYGKGYHQAFHDPCKARAVVFDDGEKPVALVGFDALIVVKPHVEEVRKRVAQETDIAPEAIMIGASHSHSSGRTGMVQQGDLDHADELVREIVKEKPTEAKALNDWIWAKEIVILDALIQKEPIRSVEVQTIQIEPAVFISNPAEYFCEFGLQQKEGSKFPFTWPVSLANDCVGYVPTSEALGPNGGGYETRLTSYSNLVPEAGDQIRDTGFALANDMKPDAVPEPAPTAKFSAGWRYGDVPPELD